MCLDTVLLDRLNEFFGDGDNMNKLVQVLNRKSQNMSLRLLDFTVCNHAKKNHILYNLNGRLFHVYSEYKTQLRLYSKKRFDPFCRKERIEFRPPECKTTITTTIAQLMFFQWCIQQGVYAYVLENAKDIEKDMLQTIASNRSFSCKKRELSPSSLLQVHNVHLPVQLSFE